MATVGSSRKQGWRLAVEMMDGIWQLEVVGG